MLRLIAIEFIYLYFLVIVLALLITWVDLDNHSKCFCCLINALVITYFALVYIYFDDLNVPHMHYSRKFIFNLSWTDALKLPPWNCQIWMVYLVLRIWNNCYRTADLALPFRNIDMADSSILVDTVRSARICYVPGGSSLFRTDLLCSWRICLEM